MASKKYKLLLGLFALLTSTTFAQMGSSYDVYDSSVVPSKRMPQQTEFWNNHYNFPAKPRNMWEVGASVGMLTISSDVAAKLPTLGFEAHVRKAFGYIFSLRLQYMNATGKGQNWLSSENYANNPAWNKSYAGRYRGANGTLGTIQYNGPATAPGTFIPNGTPDEVFYNYKAHVQDLSLEGIFTVNNIRFHKQKTGITVYGGGGIGVSLYHTMVNALDANGKPYTALFNSVFHNDIQSHANRKTVLNDLKAGMDNTYETEAENDGTRRPKIGNNTLKPSGTVLAGVAYKLSKRINIALEDRQTFIKSDLLDGQQWQEQGIGDPVQTRDFDSYNFLSLGINFNLGAKSVEPLWWLNPLDYAYSELNNPKHIKIPKPEYKDADGDGVLDQLDKEPNTPAGCPVDTHGVTKDTDGDGVPDCKDKQLITPTECQPVDADGVGKCPPPPCCQAVLDSMKNLKPIHTCPADLPSVTLKGLSLTGDAKTLLATVAAKLKDAPTCTVTLVAYPGPSKAKQALADKKLALIKNYLVEKLGISGDRIATDKVLTGGDENTIDIKTN